MKAIPAVAVLFLLSAVAAQADSVVTGTLGFTCSGGCQPPLNNLYYDTAPTSGSFTYDKTTQQFLSFSIVWDGWTPEPTDASRLLGLDRQRLPAGTLLHRLHRGISRSLAAVQLRPDRVVQDLAFR